MNNDNWIERIVQETKSSKFVRTSKRIKGKKTETLVSLRQM
jgi:hypothetical protein